MIDTIFIITDIGPGDGGKGSIIHTLTSKLKPSVIIKRGGAQGSHGINTYQGDKFQFSQWGCGTFNGVSTYLSEQLVVSPIGLINESDELCRHGIYDPFNMISASPDCICATPYHAIESQLEEIKLRNKPRGTIGSGVGRAYRMQRDLGDEYTIYTRELTDEEIIRRKIYKQIEYYKDKYKIQFKYIDKDKGLVIENLNLLNDKRFAEYIIEAFNHVGKRLKLTSLENILEADGKAIVECSHGVLTDSECGLKPHTSAIRTLPSVTYNMLKNANYNGEIVNLAVHRAYEVRHGAGPIPTYNKEFTDIMIPNNHNDENRWQGKIRAGALDLNLMRHSLDISKDTKYNGICLTCFDQVLSNERTWKICDRYEIEAHNKNDRTTEYFEKAKPVVSDVHIPDKISKKELFGMINSLIADKLGIELSILSLGKTEKDKITKINY